MGSKNRHFTDGTIGDRKRKAAWRDKVYQYERCQDQPAILSNNAYALATGATGTFGRALFASGSVFMTYQGAGQTILGPQVDIGQGALRVSCDEADNEGVDYVFADGYGAAARHAMTVNTTAPMFFKISVNITTVAGADQVLCGWRKAEGSQADFNNFDEMAAFNINAGDVFISTILNGGATSEVDTTLNWADGEDHELTTIIGNVPGQGAGYVTFLYDGDFQGVNPFTFDDGEVIVPFFYALQTATTTAIHWNWFEIGEVRNVERAT